jgi:hypothetical protein
MGNYRKTHKLKLKRKPNHKQNKNRKINKYKTRKLRGGFGERVGSHRNPFNGRIDITSHPSMILNLKPKDHYTFFGFRIKFYDFSLPEHEGYKEKLPVYNSMTCNNVIPVKYYNESLAKARFAIVITYIDTTKLICNVDEMMTMSSAGETVHSFILGTNGPYVIDDKLTLTAEDLYISLICSQETYSENKTRKWYMIDKLEKLSKKFADANNRTEPQFEEYEYTIPEIKSIIMESGPPLTPSQVFLIKKKKETALEFDKNIKELIQTFTEERVLAILNGNAKALLKLTLEKQNATSVATVKTNFGVMLSCLLFRYVKTIGIINVYNDSASEELISYYSRFNFRLGKEKCGIDDEITKQHEIIVGKNKEEKAEFIESLKAKYKTNHGYRMKLCGNKYEALCDYLENHIENTWEEIGNNDDIYMSA